MFRETEPPYRPLILLASVEIELCHGGKRADDLPLGLQVMGFAGEDARLFAIGAALRDLLEPHHNLGAAQRAKVEKS